MSNLTKIKNQTEESKAGKNFIADTIITDHLFKKELSY